MVVLFQSKFGGLVIVFWPGSIVLMPLGANERPWTDILYVWGAGIILNLGLYFILGIASYFLIRSLSEEERA